MLNIVPNAGKNCNARPFGDREAAGRRRGLPGKRIFPITRGIPSARPIKRANLTLPAIVARRGIRIQWSPSSCIAENRFNGKTVLGALPAAAETIASVLAPARARKLPIPVRRRSTGEYRRWKSCAKNAGGPGRSKDHARTGRERNGTRSGNQGEEEGNRNKKIGCVAVSRKKGRTGKVERRRRRRRRDARMHGLLMNVGA